MDDVASDLMDPLTLPSDAAPLAARAWCRILCWRCRAIAGCSRIPRADSPERALALDKRLWRSQLRAILDVANQQGLADAVAPLKALAKQVPAESQILEQLAQLYAQIGWRTERLQCSWISRSGFPTMCLRCSRISRHSTKMDLRPRPTRGSSESNGSTQAPRWSSIVP